jgi:uncharacterized membrane-anchored protein YitT (DUF2179 family)
LPAEKWNSFAQNQLTMIRQINDLYENYLQEGKKVVEILISYISYDHLKSELDNIREKPEWLEKLNIQKDVTGFKIVADGAN